MPVNTTSPYRDLPPSRRWRDAVAAHPPREVDPHDGAARPIPEGAPVMTMGSCFAQRLSETLIDSSARLLVTEPGPPFLSETQRREEGYGVYSARYGNVYSALQWLQLVQRALGAFKPVEPLWRKGESRWVDPFRPGVQPRGFESEQAALWDRAHHLGAVRRAFEQAQVLVFTLGRSECWLSAEDGAVFPTCPGSGLGGAFDPQRHVFHNSTVSEVVAQAREAIELLRTINPGLRVILTVSPVPLIATFEDRHVLQSTVCSKAVLRAACDEIVRSLTDVEYFASYEIVTATGDTAGNFEADRRTVRPEAVAQVMRCFRRRYALESRAPAAAAAPAPLSQPMCDEDSVLAAMSA